MEIREAVQLWLDFHAKMHQQLLRIQCGRTFWYFCQCERNKAHNVGSYILLIDQRRSFIGWWMFGFDEIPTISFAGM